jgi:hypothetical protein
MPSSSDAQELAARLSRIKKLLDRLERECASVPANHEVFVRIRREMEIVNQGLKPLASGPTKSSRPKRRV